MFQRSTSISRRSKIAAAVLAVVAAGTVTLVGINSASAAGTSGNCASQGLQTGAQSSYGKVYTGWTAKDGRIWQVYSYVRSDGGNRTWASQAALARTGSWGNHTSVSGSYGGKSPYVKFIGQSGSKSCTQYFYL